jgi:hypothetical protein
VWRGFELVPTAFRCRSVGVGSWLASDFRSTRNRGASFWWGAAVLEVMVGVTGGRRAFRAAAVTMAERLRVASR